MHLSTIPLAIRGLCRDNATNVSNKGGDAFRRQAAKAREVA